MKAFGAELVLTPQLGRHGVRARPRRRRCSSEGKGSVLDQFANPDNPRVHYETTGPGDLARHRRAHHALRQRDGHDRHDHGRLAVPEGEESGRSASSARSPSEGSRIPGIRKWPAGVPAEDLRPERGRRAGPGQPGRRRGDDAGASRARRASSPASRRPARAGSRCRSRARSRTRRSSSSSATAATAICRPASFPPERRAPTVLPQLRDARSRRSRSSRTAAKRRACAARPAAGRTGTTRRRCSPP